MSLSPPIHNFLEDDSLAPLKRNHACLSCKKRKVKCDGSKPACAPCMRSHAHALRTAQRNKTTPPVLTCTYADNDASDVEDEVMGTAQSVLQGSSGIRSVSNGPDARKKTGEAKKAKGSLASGKMLEREKEKRRDEEKDTLLARIAQLEARLSALTSSDRFDPIQAQSRQASSSTQESPRVWPDISYNVSPEIPMNNAYTPPLRATVEDISPLVGSANTNSSLPLISDIDFGNLFMVPAQWPHSLPSPFLLEHLVEVFFSHAPQMPRMIHRASFLTRLRLPPTHVDFPHTALLHAICAYASTFTAWVNNLPPEQLEAAVEEHKKKYNSLDGIEDFGLAQAEAAQRAIRFSTQSCKMSDGKRLIELVQANILLSDIYFTKGMPMQGWMIAGTPARILKSLEIMNRNKHERAKEPLAPEPKDAIEREERLATIWMAFIMDAGFTLNSYWNGSIELDEVYCHLPIASENFNNGDEYQPINPQTAQSPDLLANHPIADSFILAAKASTLISRVSKWLRLWAQREIVTGDELLGMRQPMFTALVNDIYVFQASVPSVMKNVMRIADINSNKAFDTNILLVHILPHLALCMLHEPFIDWHDPISHIITQMQQSHEAIVGLVHLIPSNLDISLIATSLLAFCFYSTGRIAANFVQRSMEAQQYGNAAKHRADLQTLQNILTRYGQKHQLGTMMSGFLDMYLAGIQSGKHSMSTTKCIAESMEEEGPVRVPLSAFDEPPKDARKAGVYYSEPQTYPHKMGAFERNHNMTAQQQQAQTRQTPTSARASSSTSGFTPPTNFPGATPPGGIMSGNSQSGSGTGASLSSSSGAPTPDMLEWTNHMDYGALAGLDLPSSDHPRVTTNLLGSMTAGGGTIDTNDAQWSNALGPIYSQPAGGAAYGGAGGGGNGAGGVPKMGQPTADLGSMSNWKMAGDGSQIVWGA